MTSVADHLNDLKTKVILKFKNHFNGRVKLRLVLVEDSKSSWILKSEINFQNNYWRLNMNCLSLNMNYKIICCLTKLTFAQVIFLNHFYPGPNFKSLFQRCSRFAVTIIFTIMFFFMSEPFTLWQTFDVKLFGNHHLFLLLTNSTWKCLLFSLSRVSETHFIDAQ